MAYVLGPPDTMFAPRLEGSCSASFRRTGGGREGSGFASAAGRSSSSHWGAAPPSPRPMKAAERDNLPTPRGRPIYSSRGTAAPREEITLRAPGSARGGVAASGASSDRRRGPLPSHSLAAERGVVGGPGSDLDLGQRRIGGNGPPPQDSSRANVPTLHPRDLAAAAERPFSLGEEDLLLLDRADLQGNGRPDFGATSMSADGMPSGYRTVDTPLRETFRKSASIPHSSEFPFGASNSWVAHPREGHPAYVFNPILSTVDKFSTDEKGDVFQEKTDRTSSYLEPSIKDGITFGRKKGIGEYRDIIHPMAARWNRQFHGGISTNDRKTKMFGKRQSHMTQFLDLAIRQGLDTTEMFAR